MARYTGADCKLCRREKVKLFLKGSRKSTPYAAQQAAEAAARRAMEHGMR